MHIYLQLTVPRRKTQQLAYTDLHSQAVAPGYGLLEFCEEKLCSKFCCERNFGLVYFLNI